MSRLRRARAAAASLAAALALAAGAAAGETRLAPGAGFRDDRIVHWTTVDGLPQNSVTDVASLPNGELWLSTFGGLARFDGRSFKVLDMTTDERLPANRVVALAAAGEDSLLFLTQQGHLGRVESGRSRLLLSPPEGAVEALGLLVEPSGGVLMKSAEGRLWRSDGGRPWRLVTAPAGAGLVFRDFALDARGEAWGAWTETLARLRVDGAAPAAVLPAAGGLLRARPGGGLWLSLPGRLASYVDGRLEILRVDPPVAGVATAIESQGDSVLWTAHGNEVSRLDRRPDGSWRRTVLPLGLARGVSVRCLRLDRQETLWIGTAGAGLFRLNRLPVRRYGAASGLGSVAALAGDGAGGAFVASGCSVLYHLDESGVSRPVRLRGARPAGWPPCGISLAPAGGGAVWARAGSSLFEVAPGRASGRVVASDLPEEEGPIVAAGEGSVWVVSRNGSARLVSAGGAVRRELHLPAPLMSASTAPDGALWIGGDGEVFRVGERTVDRFGAEAGVPRGLVRDVLAEPGGNVWIGTYGGGVGRMRDGRVVGFAVREGLPDSSVSRILDDQRGRMWISTNRGIAAVDRAEMRAVAEGRARAVSPVVLGEERGVPEANFGSPAGFSDGKGRLWFGTIDGAVSLFAASFPFDGTPPTVRIEEVRAGGAALPGGSLVSVLPLTNRLHVAYTAFHSLYPERMLFRFRVEGVDADWVDAGSGREVDWSPRGPGRYRFLVQARNEDGVWSRSPAEVIVDVRPAWWQTLLFRVASSLAAGVAAVVLVRRRFRGLERRHAARLLALEEQRQAEARIDALRAQLAHVSRAALAGELAASLAHEVRQPIGAIVNNAEAGRRNLAQYLRQPAALEQIFDDIVADGMRASEVVRGLRGFLQPAGSETGPVGLSSLVREMLPLLRRELRENRVEVVLSLEDLLPSVEGSRVQLGQVVVNLLLNACEALATTPGGRRVDVSTAVREGRVELVVRDNGPGPDASVADRLFEPFVTTKKDGLGVGLAICRSIAERHGGRLIAEVPPEGGLRMTLQLPATVAAEERP